MIVDTSFTLDIIDGVEAAIEHRISKHQSSVPNDVRIALILSSYLNQ